MATPAMQFVAAMSPSPASCQSVIEDRQEKRRSGDGDIGATGPTALDFRLSGLAQEQAFRLHEQDEGIAGRS